ncbi:hypothetical protein KIW84_012889 [Lathyrus oleraceus]|uniref:Uncharacterized protein n=1 Tax=Pisum sativum TaxID=3888 RepID=A0A9D5BIW4_PEA|nr:hypothetical protein KIW84_012889 [Pisum sativum]
MLQNPSQDRDLTYYAETDQTCNEALEFFLLWDLRDTFLLLTRNSNANCSPKVLKSSKRVRLNSDTTSDVELTKISRNIKVNQKRKEQWRKLLHSQQENKRGNIEREQEARLQALEAKQLEARQKFRELSAPDELSNLVSLKELGTSHNAPKLLLSNEVSKTSCKQATASELSRKEAVGFPSKVRSTDYPDNAAPLNSLSTDQISDEGYEVVSSTLCIFSSPADGRPTTSSLLVSPSKQQVLDRVLLPITDGQIPVVVPENNHEEVECQLTDNVEVNESTQLHLPFWFHLQSNKFLIESCYP